MKTTELKLKEEFEKIQIELKKMSNQLNRILKTNERQRTTKKF
jgi:hypothetical protein